MATPRRIFGAHLSVAGGLYNAVTSAITLQCDCVQIFVKNQRQWAAKPLSDEQRLAFAAAKQAAGVTPVVAHASYLLNLASPDPVARAKSEDALLDEMLRCHALALDGLVLHPGAAMSDTEAAAIARIAESLDHVIDRAGDGPTRVLLESTAGQGSAIGHRFEHLADILSAARRSERLGVCLDTCHLFASGWDFRTEEGYHEMMEACERTIGLSRIACVHTNDSKGECGSRIDRHTHIGEGRIGEAGFAHFVNDSRLLGVPFILETPHGVDGRGTDLNKVNLKRLRMLVKS